MQHKLHVILLIALLRQAAPGAEIRLVAVGRISKFETTKRSFKLNSVEGSQEQRTISGGTIANGRFPDATVAWPPRSESRPPTVNPPELNRLPPESTTVFLTNTTSCKEGDKVISCADLKATDRVRVTGDERNESRGKGLYAYEVVRLK